MPGASIDGVLVQRMARNGGPELIAGFSRVEGFGPMLMVGLGGIYVEALRDVHTLGSSAFIVGEVDAGRVARAAEAVLIDDGPLEMFAGLVADLDKHLCDWVR